MRFILCVLWCCFWWNSPASGFIKRRLGLGEPNSPEMRNKYIVEDRWFVQKLNHFNPTDNRTWKQRYQVNDRFYEVDGPVFLMIGGESAISKQWIYSGAWIDYAKKFGALCFQLEHRYYGKSHPTEDISSENLVYLSSEQALADLAEFIVKIQSRYGISSTTKWVAFGGSYAGSLAAWLRMKYPHLIYAAVSSSAPLLAKLDFKEYFKVVEDELAMYTPECVYQIKEANKQIKSKLQTNFGAKILKTKFKLCDPLDKNNKNDVAIFFLSLADNFANIVQYNKENKLHQNPEMSSVSLETLCDIMVNESFSSSLDRYAAVNDKLLSLNNIDCTYYSYDKAVNFYSNTSWTSWAAAGERQWTYQTCTEFGFYQTSSQRDHIFGNQFPVDYFVDMCTDIFGKMYNSDMLSKGIQRTNINYGGLNIKEGRVIYVHGSVDPWHALGVTRTKSENTIAIYINGTAHCANMYPPTSTDLPELTKARMTIQANLDKWLSQEDSVDSVFVDNVVF